MCITMYIASTIPFSSWPRHSSSPGDDGQEDDNNDNDGDDYDDDSDADSDALEFDDADDGIDELERLLSGEKASILEQTSDIHDTIMKVSGLYLAAGYGAHQLAQIHHLVFAIIHSTTIALPAWHHICHDHQLKV